MPESIYDPGFAAFGGGASSSILHPLVLGFVILIALLVFTLPRRYVIVPLVLGMLLIPYTQNLYIGGFHLFMYRLLVLIGWARIVFSSLTSPAKLLPGGLNTLDKLFLVWATYRALAVILLFSQMGAVTNQVAFLWDALGGYFLFRSLVESEEDIRRVVKTFAVVAVVVAAGMIYEHLTTRNFFAFLGGVRVIPEMREGRVRAQAVFGHALLAGAFGATIFPLFLWLWKRWKARFFPLVGMASCIVITLAASTSTPILTMLGGIFAIFLWPVRGLMRAIRWGMVIALIELQLIMKAPVWFLLNRIDLAGGSTGYHRAVLIDNFIRHFSDWWLIGTHDNVNWGWDMWDQCNQYILEGQTGGLVALACFIAMFCICYRWIGNARKAVEGNKEKEWLIWFIGAAFFAQTLAYFGVDYFDQSKAVWYLFLVMITVITQSPSKEASLSSLAPTEEEVPSFRRRWGQLQVNRCVSQFTETHSRGKAKNSVPLRSASTQDSLAKMPRALRLPRG